MSYKTRWVLGGVETEYFDLLMEVDISQSSDEIYADRRFSSCRYHFCDFLGADLTYLNVDDPHKTLVNDLLVSKRFPDVKLALVAEEIMARTLCEGYIRSSLELGNVWEMKLFDRKAHALDWCSN